ncbi:MAG: hypothetical protein V4581_12125 [Bacteroidota bacterium]
MKTMKEKIETVRREFDKTAQKLTAYQLVKYPEGSLGHQLGTFLLGSNYGQNVYAQNDDALQLLIAGKNSIKEDLAVQFYLFGNGNNSFRTLSTIVVALTLCPHYLPYFYKKYKAGKQALRFYDVDHLGLLHLPVERIKDVFLIR